MISPVIQSAVVWYPAYLHSTFLVAEVTFNFLPLASHEESPKIGWDKTHIRVLNIHNKEKWRIIVPSLSESDRNAFLSFLYRNSTLNPIPEVHNQSGVDEMLFELYDKYRFGLRFKSDANDSP